MIRYARLRQAGVILSTYGKVVGFIGAGLWSVAAVILMTTCLTSAYSIGFIGMATLMTVFFCCVMAVLSWVAGIFISAGGESFLALADMAQNSWGPVELIEE